MKHPNGLNHHYFVGQVFNLDQKTMNEMIEDIHKLLGDREALRVQLMEHKIEQRILSSFITDLTPKSDDA